MVSLHVKAFLRVHSVSHETHTPNHCVGRFPLTFFRPPSFAPRCRMIATTSFIRGGCDALLLAPVVECALDVAEIAVTVGS